MIWIFKILQVFFLASIKYVVTFPYAILLGLSFYHTIIAVTLGGIAGFLFFYHLSGFALNKFLHFKTFLWQILPPSFRMNYRKIIIWRKKRTGESVFSKRNRLIVKLRMKLGLPGIIILSPIILSLPIGAFLLHKYYPKEKHVKPYMILSIVSWTSIYILIALVFPGLIK